MDTEGIFRGKWALVTGASSGFGREFAQQLSGLGAKLVLVARSRERLESLERELSDAGTEVLVHPADLRRAEDRAAVFERLDAKGIEVDHLVNNAGVGLSGAFAQSEITASVDLVRLNCEAIVELTRRALPSMIERNRGGVIQVASIVALSPLPYMATYGASKAFVLAFTEALVEELSATGVRMMALCPGASPTEFRERAGIGSSKPPLGELSADKVVHRGLLAYVRRRRVCVPGMLNRAGASVSPLVPRSILAKVAAGMMQRLGRTE